MTAFVYTDSRKMYYFFGLHTILLFNFFFINIEMLLNYFCLLCTGTESKNLLFNFCSLKSIGMLLINNVLHNSDLCIIWRNTYLLFVSDVKILFKTYQRHP